MIFVTNLDEKVLGLFFRLKRDTEKFPFKSGIKFESNKIRRLV